MFLVSDKSCESDKFQPAAAVLIKLPVSQVLASESRNAHAILLQLRLPRRHQLPQELKGISSHPYKKIKKYPE